MVRNGVVYTCKTGRERYLLFRTIDQTERTCLVIRKIMPSRLTLILYLLSTQDESNVTFSSSIQNTYPQYISTHEIPHNTTLMFCAVLPSLWPAK